MSENDLSTGDVWKENWKLALNVFLRTVLVAVLCFFVYMSLSTIVQGVSTHRIGYEIWERDENSNWSMLEQHLDETGATSTAGSTRNTTTSTGTTVTSSSGTTAGKGNSSTAGGTSAETGSKDKSSGGSTAEESLPTNQQKRFIYSEVPKGASLALDIISEIFMLLLLASFPYTVLWPQGDRDKNKVQFGHMAEDKLRGLKVGLIAGIPSYIGYILLILSHMKIFTPAYYGIFRLMNMPFMPLLDLMAGGVQVRSAAAISLPGLLGMGVTILLVPLVCHLAYTLGYKQISLIEKFIYVNPNKKKKRRR